MNHYFLMQVEAYGSKKMFLLQNTEQLMNRQLEQTQVTASNLSYSTY